MLYVLFSTKFSKTCLRLHARTSHGVLVHRVRSGAAVCISAFHEGATVNMQVPIFVSEQWPGHPVIILGTSKYEQRIVPSFSR